MRHGDTETRREEDESRETRELAFVLPPAGSLWLAAIVYRPPSTVHHPRSKQLCACFVFLALLLSGCVRAVTTPTATPVSAAQPTIALASPQSGQSIESPVVLRGSISEQPVDGKLNYRIFDGSGSLLAQGTLPVIGPAEGPGQFDGVATFSTSQTGPGRVELIEISPTDGSIRAAAAITVIIAAGGTTVATIPAPIPTLSVSTPGTLVPTQPTAVVTPAATGIVITPVATTVPQPGQQSITIETPPSGTQVGSPMTLTGRTALFPPGGQLTYRVRDAAGNQIGQGTIVVQQSGGGGVFTAQLTFAEPQNGGSITAELSQQGATAAVVVLYVAPPQSIVFDSPPPGAQVGSPMTVTGRTARYPFQGTLGYRVYNAANQAIGQGLFGVNGAPGGPSSFVGQIFFTLPPPGDIRVELIDEDGATGQVAARQSLTVRVGQAPPGPTATLQPTAVATVLPTASATSVPGTFQVTIESPVSGAPLVTSPLTVTGRVTLLPENRQLHYRVRSATGRLLGEGAFPITGTAGQPATFSARITFTQPDQNEAGTIEVFDLDLSGAQRGTALVVVQLRGAAYPGP